MPGIRKSRLLPLAAFAARASLVGAACAPASKPFPPNLHIALTGQLTTVVVDAPNDAGRGASVAFDATGDPSVSYLLVTPVLKPGELPAAVVAGQPQPPSVVVATQKNGIWSRTAVTGIAGVGEKDVGSAQGISDAKGHAIAGVRTGLAVDGQGKHHVIWSTPGSLYYADDTTGSYGKPEQVTPIGAAGGSIAVASDGTPWISFIQSGTLMVATRQGSKWTSQVVTRQAGPTSPAPADSPALDTSIRVAGDGTPVVAYGSGDRTLVSRRAVGGWTTVSPPAAGGLAVSLALDKSDDPHLAFYDSSGNVRHAHLVGGSWEVNQLGSAGQPKTPGGDPAWSTGIALDDQGTHHISWTDSVSHTIQAATNEGGSFRTQTVPGSLNGTNPTIGVSSDGKKVAVAWFDSVNANLDVATTVGASGPLAFSPAPPTFASPSASAAACKPNGTGLKVTAPQGASGSGFDTKCLAAPAGQAFTVVFANQDITIHNFAIFESDPLSNPSAKLLGGAPSPSDLVQPGSSTTYKVSALQAGTYFFHCDVHPTTMNGTFVVSK